jgi:hypothetical protein
MKKIALAAAFAATASTAFAGNVSEPVMEAPVVMAEPTGSSSAILLVLIGAVAANG